MALRSNEAVGLPSQISNFRRRDIIWLWGYLQQLGCSLSTGIFHDKQARNQALSMGIHRFHIGPIESLIAQRGAALIPVDQIDWIRKSDRRLMRWAYHAVERSVSKWRVYNLPELELSELIVAKIDLWAVDPKKKADTVRGLRDGWGYIRRQDKQLDWIDQTDQYQCRWFWDYICEKNLAITGNYPANDKELFSEILHAFDCWQVDAELRKGFISKMRSTWGKRGQRERGDKRQCNFLISIEARANLEVIAKSFGKPLSATVEILINNAHERLSREGR